VTNALRLDERNHSFVEMLTFGPITIVTIQTHVIVDGLDITTNLT